MKLKLNKVLISYLRLCRIKLRQHFEGEIKLGDEEVQMVGRKIIKYKRNLKDFMSVQPTGGWKREE